MKLLSMTDFVLEQTSTPFGDDKNTSSDRLVKIEKYANFLKQHLKLGMFVPCDENGNVLEEPNAGMSGYDHVYKNYDKAKERCLFEFESCYLSFDKSDMKDSNIEELLSDNRVYILTQTAIKQLGL